MPLQAAARVAHPAEELVAGGAGPGTGATSDLAVRGVQRLPHLRRDRLARTTCVLPRRTHGAGDRAREREVLREQGGDGRRVGLTADRLRVGTHHVEQRAADRALVGAAVLEEEVVVHVEQARGVLGPLDVATDPVQRLGDATQHGRTSLSGLIAAAAAAGSPARAADRASGAAECIGLGACRRHHRRHLGRRLCGHVTTVVGGREHPRVLGATALAGVHDQAASGQRDPGEAAGHHPHVAPSFTANGRRSRWRAPICPSTNVGAVDSATGSCAIQPAGSLEHLHPEVGERRLAWPRARSRALAAGPVDRLEHELVDVGRAPTSHTSGSSRR